MLFRIVHFLFVGSCYDVTMPLRRLIRRENYCTWLSVAGTIKHRLLIKTVDPKLSGKMDTDQALPCNVEKLINACVIAKEYSYSPYSKFRVGAALLTATDEIITGCNVENVSYGLAICAERTALVKAVSEGHKKFKAIAVTTDVKTTFTYPCGACRQFMAEFGDFDVYLVSVDGKVRKSTVNDLLPFSFQQKDLHEGQENNDLNSAN